LSALPDLAVFVFTAILVFGAFTIPRLGDALGRAVRGRRSGGGRPDDPGQPRR
jgi:Sec-independent protein translocase protein TatA